MKTLIILSRESRWRLLEEIQWAIQLSKGKAAYQLITILVPKIGKWGLHQSNLEQFRSLKLLDEILFKQCLFLHFLVMNV